ncbi:MAG TPA: hypothetical protein VE420_05265 [Gemmatimonadales bacterium]|jgi:hypothetical protein|nr:hypothetical protein [Gemmatimonadales bacterium]
MHHRTLSSLISALIAGLATLMGAPSLHAQALLASVPSPSELAAPELLNALANYRAVRWASASPVIHCAPAPLTERPGAQLELARPPVMPIEESFADAQSVKRAIAYRTRAVAVERR